MFGLLEDLPLGGRHQMLHQHDDCRQLTCGNGWTISFPDDGLTEENLFRGRQGVQIWSPCILMSGLTYKASSYMPSSLSQVQWYEVSWEEKLICVYIEKFGFLFIKSTNAILFYLFCYKILFKNGENVLEFHTSLDRLKKALMRYLNKLHAKYVCVLFVFLIKLIMTIDFSNSHSQMRRSNANVGLSN